jgi:hypothetical protein
MKQQTKRKNRLKSVLIEDEEREVQKVFTMKRSLRTIKEDKTD